MEPEQPVDMIDQTNIVSLDWQLQDVCLCALIYKQYNSLWKISLKAGLNVTRPQN